MPGPYEKPPSKKDNETKEELYYRLLVQVLIKLDIRAEIDHAFEVKEILTKEVLEWWRAEKADERSEIVRLNRLRSEQRRVSQLKAKLTPGELELLKQQAIGDAIKEMEDSTAE